VVIAVMHLAQGLALHGSNADCRAYGASYRYMMVLSRWGRCWKFWILTVCGQLRTNGAQLDYC
jgi:hypothetical protein